MGDGHCDLDVWLVRERRRGVPALSAARDARGLPVVHGKYNGRSSHSVHWARPRASNLGGIQPDRR